MRNQWITKPSLVQRVTAAGATFPEAGHTFAELLAATAALGIVVGSLYVPFTAAVEVVRSMRENLRATQIVMHKAEALSLFTSSQACDASSQPKPLFVVRDETPGVAGSQCGMQYTGYLSTAADAPNAFRTNPCTVTVTLCWTNYDGRKPIVHQRGIQTRLARNGMPKYIWGAL